MVEKFAVGQSVRRLEDPRLIQGLGRYSDDVSLPHEAHAVLLCVQSGSTLADPNRFKFEADDFYLKSAREMRAVWAELPEA